MKNPLTVGRRPNLAVVAVIVVIALVAFLIGRGTGGSKSSGTAAPVVHVDRTDAAAPSSNIAPGPVQQPEATQALPTQSSPQSATSSAGTGAQVGVGLTPGVTLSGVAGASTQAAGDFGTMRGKPVQVVVNYASVQNWAAMDDLSKNGLLYRGTPTSVHRVFSLPLITTDLSSTLQDGADGKDDQYFRSFAQQLVQGGQQKATLRIGWEMTGDWFPWNGQKDPATWVLAYRKAVDAMRSVPGQQFTFDWNVQLGFADPEPLYPGDDYVDIIGVDHYDVSFSGDYAPTDHEKVWQHLLDQSKGLTWLADFAKTHGKRMSFPEWGLSNRCDGHGGDDDPYFIQQLHDWIAAHDVAYEAYYNSYDAGVCATFDLTSGEFPQSQALYRKLFGGSA